MACYLKWNAVAIFSVTSVLLSKSFNQFHERLQEDDHMMFIVTPQAALFPAEMGMKKG